VAVRRLQFELRSNGAPIRSYTLVVNPESYDQEQAGRGTVTHTQGGAWLDADGASPPVINFAGLMSGTKPHTSAEGVVLSQIDAFKELKTNIIEAYWDMTRDDSKASGAELYFYNWTNGEFFSVYPMRFKVLQSVKEPTLHRYEVSLQALRPIQAGRQVPDPVSEEFEDAGLIQRSKESAEKMRWAGAQLASLMQGGMPNALSIRLYFVQFQRLWDDMTPSERPNNVNFPGIRTYEASLNRVAEGAWYTGSHIVLDQMTWVNRADVDKLFSDVSALVLDLEDTAKLPKTPSSVVSLLVTIRDKLDSIRNTPGLFSDPFTLRRDGTSTPI
jgi:hypothetical protein